MQMSIKYINLDFTEHEFYISCIFAYLSEYMSGKGFRPPPGPPKKFYLKLDYNFK